MGVGQRPTRGLPAGGMRDPAGARILAVVAIGATTVVVGGLWMSARVELRDGEERAAVLDVEATRLAVAVRAYEPVERRAAWVADARSAVEAGMRPATDWTALMDRIAASLPPRVTLVRVRALAAGPAGPGGPVRIGAEASDFDQVTLWLERLEPATGLADVALESSALARDPRSGRMVVVASVTATAPATAGTDSRKEGT